MAAFQLAVSAQVDKDLVSKISLGLTQVNSRLIQTQVFQEHVDIVSTKLCETKTDKSTRAVEPYVQENPTDT